MKTKLSIRAGVAMFLYALSAYASQPKLQVLYNFQGGKDGFSASAGLIADAAGNLYGTTSNGGDGAQCLSGEQLGCGVVFELTPPKIKGGAWSEHVLYVFTGGTDGALPHGKLIFDSVGNIYGTASAGGNSVNCEGGCGVVFELSPSSAPGGNWVEHVLYAFAGTEGASPSAGLIFDTHGSLYGTVLVGGGGPLCSSGQLTGCGAVFEIAPASGGGGSWTETTIYAFSGGTDGSSPQSDLVFDSIGNLYGTTSYGGAGAGVVFELSPLAGVWNETVLYTFAQGNPTAGIRFDGVGNLYGTAADGGGSDECRGGCGFVYLLMPSGGAWTESTIYAFGKTHSAIPYAPVTLDKKGTVYGTTFGSPGLSCGSLFRLSPNGAGWQEAEYPLFAGRGSPCALFGELVFGKLGALYGTSAAGGNCKKNSGCGTVFGIMP